MSAHPPFHFLTGRHSIQSTQWTVGCVVLLIHLCVLGLGLFWTSPPLPLPPRSKVRVQTIQLNPVNTSSRPVVLDTPVVAQSMATIESSLPPIIADTPASLPPEVIASPTIIPSSEPALKPQASLSSIDQAPQAKPAPVKQEIKKPTIPKPITKPKPVAEAKPVVKKTPVVETKPKTPSSTVKPKTEVDSKQQKIDQEAEKARQQAQVAQEIKVKQQQEKLAQARQSLAKISDTRKQTSALPSSSLDSKDLPQLIGRLEVDSLPISASPSGAVWGTQESRYQDRLIAQLESHLRLPDYGTIQLKLELNREGHVMQMQIIKSENNKNQAYIERMLPSLSFASFGKEFEGASTYTFTITLRNKTP
jgi:colicin import membrane protein